MATDIRGLFSNNRRRETNAVSGSVPFVLAPADLRTGTDVEEASNGGYTVLTLPAGVLVTGINAIIEEGNEFSSGTFKATIGGTEVIPAATPLDTAGVVRSAAEHMLTTAGGADVVITLAGGPAGSEVSIVNLVIDYIDFNRATMSYIGEE